MFENIIPVTLSSRAVEEVKGIMNSKGIPPNYGLRIAVKGGGCSAVPIIGFDKKNEFDLEYHIAGISIYIDKRHTMYLIGKEVDFHDSADARGFFFRDANNGPS